MTRTLTIITALAAVAVAGCEPETIVAGPAGAEPGANAAANANVQLPPSIAASKIYRCAGNGLVYVDWMSDGKSANIRTERYGEPTRVAAAEAGQPMTAASGHSLTGTADAPSVTIALPEQSAKTCKA